MLMKGIDRSLTEQLSLLGARPPGLLPFMITSRMNGGSAVVTQVGLFTADRAPIVGTLTSIPGGLVLDGKVHRAWSDDGSVSMRAAGTSLDDGRLLVVARDVTDVADIRNDLFAAGLRLALPTLALTLVSGLVIGFYGERRLREINEMADRIIRGDLSLRLPINQSDGELDRLCLIFNRVLSRLDEGVEALRHTGENIAHDLRTPLTSVRAKLERAARHAAPDKTVATLIEQCIAGIDQSLATITALLRISDLEHARRTAAFSAFPLGPVLCEIIEVFAPIAEDRGLSLDLCVTKDAEVWGDRGLVLEAIVNLVDNAIKFTPSGGRVTVSLLQDPKGPIISVADTGPGIPEAMRASVLDRFVQLDQSRQTAGHGLGLSLVKAICKLHQIHLEIGGDAHGTVVSIEFGRNFDG